MIEVTVLFKDQPQFEKFLKTNKVEEYTWRKGRITIDMTATVKEAMADAPSRQEELTTKEVVDPSPVEDVPPPPVEMEPTPSGSIF